MPDRLTAIVGPEWLGVGTREQFHLGEPLAALVDEVRSAYDSNPRPTVCGGLVLTPTFLGSCG